MAHYRIYYTMSMDIVAKDEDDARDKFDNMTPRQLGEDAYDVQIRSVTEVNEKK